MVVNTPHFGVSKKCCPVCRSILQALYLERREPIGNLASHPQVCPSAFPPGLPKGVTEQVLGEYRCLLQSELLRLTRRRNPSSMMSLADGGRTGNVIGQVCIEESAEEDWRGVIE